MVVATFDTLKFANTLKAAGVPDKQAEAQAAAFAEVIQLNFKELVTKEDLAHAASDLRKEIAELRKDMVAGFREQDQKFTAALKEQDQKFTAALKEVEQRIATAFAKQHGENILLRWMIGVGLTMGVAILVRLFIYGGVH